LQGFHWAILVKILLLVVWLNMNKMWSATFLWVVEPAHLVQSPNLAYKTKQLTPAM
jgi:hypothetical protein